MHFSHSAKSDCDSNALLQVTLISQNLSGAAAHAINGDNKINNVNFCMPAFPFLKLYINFDGAQVIYS